LGKRRKSSRTTPDQELDVEDPTNLLVQVALQNSELLAHLLGPPNGLGTLLRLDGTPQNASQRFLIGEHPGVEALDGDTERAPELHGDQILCFLDMLNSLGNTVPVDYEDQRVESALLRLQDPSN